MKKAGLTASWIFAERYFGRDGIVVGGYVALAGVINLTVTLWIGVGVGTGLFGGVLCCEYLSLPAGQWKCDSDVYECLCVTVYVMRYVCDSPSDACARGQTACITLSFLLAPKLLSYHWGGVYKRGDRRPVSHLPK
jgi:hypothetical protein